MCPPVTAEMRDKGCCLSQRPPLQKGSSRRSAEPRLADAVSLLHCVFPQPHSSGSAGDAGRAQTGCARRSSLSSAGQHPHVRHALWAACRSLGPAAPGRQGSPGAPLSLPQIPAGTVGQLRRPPAPLPSGSKLLQRWGPHGAHSGLPQRGPGAYPAVQCPKEGGEGPGHRGACKPPATPRLRF